MLFSMAIRGPFPDRGVEPRDYLLPGQIISRPLGVKTKVGAKTKGDPWWFRFGPVSSAVPLPAGQYHRVVWRSFKGMGRTRKGWQIGKFASQISYVCGDESGLILRLESIFPLSILPRYT
jgi:hypothetical protein